ncbi:hypothetical protein QQP08_001841 [Theobroma cacao]|nr:hypothetical protein QQP08_001841 [Theobroma cacao]
MVGSDVAGLNWNEAVTLEAASASVLGAEFRFDKILQEMGASPNGRGLWWIIVIGVFLTQNVSDKLSSSAFMSLAAKFPPKTSCKGECDEVGAKLLIEELKVGELNPNDSITWRENVFSHPLDSQSSIIDCRRDSDISGIERRSFTETFSQSLEKKYYPP